MPSKPIGPWWYEGRGYHCWLNGRKRPLGVKKKKDKKKAWANFHALMAEEGKAEPGTPAAAAVGVAELGDRFLQWVKANRKPETYTHHEWIWRDFLAILPTNLAAADLRPFHVQRWIDGHAGWSSSTRNRAATSVKRAYSWGVEQGYLNADPVRPLRKAKMGRREFVLSAEQWAAVIDAAGGYPQLRAFLVAMRDTGCRPKELRQLEARHLDRTAKVWRFQSSEGKGDRFRIVVPPAHVWEESVAAADRQGAGTIYRNRAGRAWTRSGLHSVVYRLSKRAGVPGLCAYTTRHTYATDALAAGVDAVTLGVLMGHADPSMVGRVYQHLADRPAYLAEASERAAAAGRVSGGGEGERAGTAEPPASGEPKAARPATLPRKGPTPSRRGKRRA